MRERMHVTVEGRVQGVCFRMCAVETAEALGLSGWVCNSGDGAVELEAEGERADLGRLLDWCRVGPPAARVDAVYYHFEPALGEFEGFHVRR